MFKDHGIKNETGRFNIYYTIDGEHLNKIENKTLREVEAHCGLLVKDGLKMTKEIRVWNLDANEFLIRRI